MMTLLQICQQVAREIGAPAPSVIAGNTDQTAVQLLAAAQTEGKTLAKGVNPAGFGRHNWQALRKEQTFTTSNGVNSYALSTIVTDGDYDRMEPDTWWDRTNDRPMNLVAPQEWQQVTSGIGASAGICRRILLRGNAILVYPTPSSADTLAFEYISNQWCESSGGTGQTAWAMDTDVPKLDDYLLTLGIKWRFLAGQGEAYAEEKAEYERQVNAAMSADQSSTVVSHMPSSRGIAFPVLPETGYGGI